MPDPVLQERVWRAVHLLHQKTDLEHLPDAKDLPEDTDLEALCDGLRDIAIEALDAALDPSP